MRGPLLWGPRIRHGERLEIVVDESRHPRRRKGDSPARSRANLSKKRVRHAAAVHGNNGKAADIDTIAGELKASLSADQLKRLIVRLSSED